MAKKNKVPKEKSQKQLQKEAQKKEKETQKKDQTHFLDEILPVPSWNYDLNVGIMDDGSIIDLVGIMPKNLMSASTDEIDFDNSIWDKLYKTYADNLKIICFNYPSDTRDQIAHIDKVLARTRNPIFIETLEIKKSELIFINKERKDRVSVLCFFAKDIDDYKQKYSQIYSKLENVAPPLIHKLSNTEKKRIFENMYNMTKEL